MRAADLLTIMTINPQKRSYQKICHERNNVLWPLTGIESLPGQIIFVFEEKKSPIAIKDVMIFLMKNREKNIYRRENNEIQLVYGIKETEDTLLI